MPGLIGFNDYKIHTITGSLVAQTNYDIGIKVYYGSGTDGTETVDGETFGKVYCNSKCKTDFGDLRFALANGTLLDFWIESQSDGNYAIIWVEADTIPASPSTKDIYVCYGNSSAVSIKNGDNTFRFFDDFDTFDTVSKWGGDTAYGSVSGSILTFNNTSTGYRRIDTQNYYAKGIKRKERMQFTSLVATSEERAESGSDNGTDETYVQSHTANATFKLSNTKSGITTQINMDNKDNSYHNLTIYIPAGDASISARMDSSTLYTNTNNVPVGNFRFGWLSGPKTDVMKIDWIEIMNYVTPEPTHTSWSEELVNTPLTGVVTGVGVLS